MEETIRRLVSVFDQSGARWALVGAHAVGMITEPRATADLDFVIEEARLKTVLEALRDELGELDDEDIGPAVRLKALNVDLIRSATHPLFGEALRRTRILEQWSVPVTEALIALKFLAAISPWRAPEKRLHDLGDLVALYRAARDELDPALLRRLAGMAYPGAEREFEALLERIDRGEPLRI